MVLIKSFRLNASLKATFKKESGPFPSAELKSKAGKADLSCKLGSGLSCWLSCAELKLKAGKADLSC